MSWGCVTDYRSFVVTYASQEGAEAALDDLHLCYFNGAEIGCYWVPDQQ